MLSAQLHHQESCNFSYFCAISLTPPCCNQPACHDFLSSDESNKSQIDGDIIRQHRQRTVKPNCRCTLYKEAEKEISNSTQWILTAIKHTTKQLSFWMITKEVMTRTKYHILLIHAINSWMPTAPR